MRTVNSNSEAELAPIEVALRALAANILRVIRGAGQSSELVNQAVAFMGACIAFKEATELRP